jgi:hypothetical protein
LRKSDPKQDFFSQKEQRGRTGRERERKREAYPTLAILTLTLLPPPTPRTFNKTNDNTRKRISNKTKDERLRVRG